MYILELPDLACNWTKKSKNKMPTQEQSLIIQQAQDKISVLKNCVQEVENELHETTLGLQDMKEKIHHQ